MEPNRSTTPDSDPESDLFLSKLVLPLRYLRGLEVDQEFDSTDASKRVMPDVPEHRIYGDPELAGRVNLTGATRSEEIASDVASTPPPVSPPGAETPVAALSNSIVKRLEKMLGFAPALDLVPPGEELPQGFGLSEERYTIEGELGAGGMGRVLLIYDQDIRRHVAMKVLRDDVTEPKSVTRFLEEAQATGQLEHPNIAPVYDIGIDKQGRVFFTMKLVRGRDLGEIIRDLAIGRPEVRQHFTLTRLVQILQQASMGVHYGHVRGVVHRDLKPDNVMVGDFGEVLVMDWGLAKISGRHEDDSIEHPDDTVDSFRAQSGFVTLDGTIQGTLAYMSPEQARGWQDEIDERTDVFGLGTILYQLLTFHPPYDGKDVREILGKAGVGEITPPSKRAPRNRIPSSLEAICLKALSSAKEDRYQTANAFHEALQVYLDGSAESQRRRQEASLLARQGRERISEYRRLQELEKDLLQRAEDSKAGVEPHDPADKKAASWELEDESVRVHQDRINVFNEATSSLHSAIDVDENCGEARQSLATLYWDRFVEAEGAGNEDDMTLYRGLVERYHDGHYEAQLEGKGSLQIHSEPPGAQVVMYRVEERGRTLVEVDGEICGITPLDLELPLGDHLVVLRQEGFRDTRCPVSIERCGKQVLRTKMFRDSEIGEGFLHVPAGEVVVGGNSSVPGSLPVGKRYVDDFFISEFPVTFREYCAFLDDLYLKVDPELKDLVPRTEKEAECVILGQDDHFRPDSDKLVDSPTRDRYDEGFAWDLPVLAVTWNAARRYCEWLSQRLGRRIRLPRDVEWEKAARGVSRSAHPWGNFFDWSFAKGGLSRPEPPQPEPVGAFATDRSVYLVRDLAGCIREWCEDWYIEGVGRLIRGGYWGNMSPRSFQSAVRGGANESMRSAAVGFRVVAEPHGTVC